MSVRFLMWTTFMVLMFSGAAGWIFTGEREVAPEVQKIEAYQVTLLSERRSAENGGAPDWTRYARSLVTGPEELRDPKEALKWYKKAADAGYVPAQVGLGDLYGAGVGVRQDHHKAQEWYQLAARLSKNADAHFRVGEGYFRGLGRSRDYAEALTHYMISAKQGHPIAQYLVGSMYEAGWGVDQSAIDAWVWYSRALPHAAKIAAHEEEYDVASALKRVASTMNQSQLDFAKKKLTQPPG